MVQGLADEDDIESQDKGPLAYQESKVFQSEPFLVNVYDNVPKKFVTFEVYGLDTQNMLHLYYTYADFDGLFRFNAELMNPNRKEGRFHWVIERLEIATVGNDRKLRLGSKISEEVPELPVYEMNRKIPTGRMDLKERQHLRDCMDMLNIKRDENIARKRRATREAFLRHIFKLKAEDERHKKEVEEKIAYELLHRNNLKEELEKKEIEEQARLDAMKKVRRKAVEVKEERTEEQEEEELKGIRSRWKEKDRIKAQHAAELALAHEKHSAERKQAIIDEDAKQVQLDLKRQAIWAARDKRVMFTEKTILDANIEKKRTLDRHVQSLAERNQELLSDLHRDRQPIFAAALERTQEREYAREAEIEAVKKYLEQREIPKKVNKKAKKPGAKKKVEEKEPAAEDKKEKAPKEKKEKGEKKGKEKKEDKAEEKESEADRTEKVLDAVEAKMRKDMAEAKRRDNLEKHREDTINDLVLQRKDKEKNHMKAYKAQYRQKMTDEEAVAAERRLVLKQKEKEKTSAADRKKQESERLRKVREANVERKEKERLAAQLAL